MLSVRPFRRVIKDYFLICESYLQAIKGATPSPDRGHRHGAARPARRGLGSPAGGARRAGELDHDTARRLFTLICVLHIRG